MIETRITTTLTPEVLNQAQASLVMTLFNNLEEYAAGELEISEVLNNQDYFVVMNISQQGLEVKRIFIDSGLDTEIPPEAFAQIGVNIQKYSADGYKLGDYADQILVEIVATVPFIDCNDLLFASEAQLNSYLRKINGH